MPSSEIVVGAFTILGTVAGASVSLGGAVRLDGRRRSEAVRAARTAAVETFLLSARTCIQNVALTQGAHGVAREADRSWRLGNRRALGDRAVRMMDAGTLDGLAELVALRFAVDRLRMTWGEHRVVDVAAEAVERIHDAAAEAAQNESPTLTDDVRFINARLDALASIAHRDGE